MKPFEVVPGVHWMGALDPQLRVFDVIIRADNGTSYNSYLVRGERGSALIDTVKGKYARPFLENLASLLAPEDLAWIVVNHTEPDHAGALDSLLSWAPKAKMVCSRNALPFVKALLSRENAARAVGDGESIDLGGMTLRFVEAPFLHWPDTMFTYLPERRILFPCDFLGSHYCDDRMFDDRCEDFTGAFRFYYDFIFRPFKEYVLRALAKVETLPVDMVCPSHGPILRAGAARAMALYREWSTPLPRGKGARVAVFFASAYGNTGRMAEEVAAGARAAGAEVELVDLLASNPAGWPDAVERADAVAVGSPTINGDAVKPAWDLLSSLATVKLKGKAAAAFGSYAWSGEAVKLLSERLKGLRFKVASEGVRAHFVPTGEDLEACRALGRALTAPAG